MLTNDITIGDDAVVLSANFLGINGSVSADMFSCTLLNRRVGHLDVSEYGLKCRK